MTSAVAGALPDFREAFPCFRAPFKDLGDQVQRYLAGESYTRHTGIFCRDTHPARPIALLRLLAIESAMPLCLVGAPCPPTRFVPLAYRKTRVKRLYHSHLDGDSHAFIQGQRLLLWYLDDLPGPGGETEFLYQGIQIRPEQGTRVLFPPVWNGERRVANLHAGVKVIATTWVVFA